MIDRKIVDIAIMQPNKKLLIKHDINVTGTSAANIRGKNAPIQKAQTEILPLFPLKILKYSSETHALYNPQS